MSIVKAIKAYLYALHGITATKNTIAGVISEVAEEAPGISVLPQVTSDDNGKVLSVSGGAWGAAPAPTELPEVTASDNGKFLTVANGAWEAGAVPTELPSVTASDNGKVLKVVDGAWAAVAEE